MNELRSRSLIPVVLSGGSGTRLWPLSREAQPKQFLPLLSTTSLFQQTLLRVRHLGGLRVQAPIVVCNAGHRELVVEQAAAVAAEIGALVLEPGGRNTAAAIAAAALLAREAGSPHDANPLLLVLPADHVVADTTAFAAAVEAAAAAAAAGRLVTFGVVPDRPETGFGYIQRGEAHGAWAAIRRFVEKPDLATAEEYVRSGDYLWNSGMFVFSTADVLAELATHAGAVLAACHRAVDEAERDDGALRLSPAFLDSPATSIDYAIMEKTARGAVVPLAAGWSDVGSWSALHDVLPQDEAGNAVIGNALLESCTQTLVLARGRFVAAIGLDDVVIVETEDAVLVAHRDRVQDVKGIVDAIKSRGRGPR
jgi:mannose-1-phosphate guanylyltransferase/mannose-6-phosphate isomerase